MADRFSIDRIDDAIHGRIRLGVMIILASSETATFNEMKARLKASQGNLSVHLRKLEEAGYVSITRRIIDRKTELRARLTPKGRKAFADYIAEMKSLIERAGG